MKTIPGYITKNDAATRLGITRRTLDRHIQKNHLPTYRFLGDATIYVAEKDVNNLLNPIRKDK